MRARDVVLAVLVAVIWGLAFVATRVGLDAFSPPQLVALRFASDAELPELCRDVLDGKLATSKEIKQRVKSWQPDWLRA